MLGWAIVIFAGLAFVFVDMKPINRARLLGYPMLVHTIVIGSGILLHGGSALGMMAAIASGVMSAIAMKMMRYLFGYIRGKTWYPGRLQVADPRLLT
jgi:hypothetical protein